MAMYPTYMKMVVRNGGAKHLAAADKPDSEGTTLCGCSIVQAVNWRRITTLEGDECPKCASQAFWPTAAVPSRPRSTV